VIVRPRARDLELLGRWLDEGRMIPVVEKVYPLDLIADAEAHVETKHARGKVVVAID
jgi:NADPH:quinone reductase-like Zn-dependent oxidoreductase